MVCFVPYSQSSWQLSKYTAFVVCAGRLQVADFGRARMLNPMGVVRAQSYATITHMAPEVLTDLLLSPASDVYAFGMLLWQVGRGAV